MAKRKKDQQPGGDESQPQMQIIRVDAQKVVERNPVIDGEREKLVRDLADAIRKQNWAALPETEEYQANLREEVSNVEIEAIEGLWDPEKVPDSKKIVSWRARRRVLKNEIAHIQAAADGALLREAIGAIEDYEREDELVKRAAPCDWPPTREGYMAEAQRRINAGLVAAAKEA